MLLARCFCCKRVTLVSRTHRRENSLYAALLSFQNLTLCSSTVGIVQKIAELSALCSIAGAQHQFWYTGAFTACNTVRIACITAVHAQYPAELNDKIVDTVSAHKFKNGKKWLSLPLPISVPSCTNAHSIPVFSAGGFSALPSRCFACWPFYLRRTAEEHCRCHHY